VIDLATLTGSCVGALSRRFAGVFSNRFGDGDHGCSDLDDDGGEDDYDYDDQSGGAAAGRALRAVVRVGERSGERLWPFPLDGDYAETLKGAASAGSGADFVQCLAGTSEADHMYAAAFLEHFVKPSVPWLHMDLAGPAAVSGGNGAHVRGRGGSGDVPTGFGVRAVLEMVLDRSSWKALVRDENDDGDADEERK
jgi:leucyl aminopeptidase